MSGPSIPIESDPELLAEYGRAFAWFNLIEYVLGNVITFRGKLNLADPKLAKNLIDKTTLGGKITLASKSDLILPSTKKLLEKLVRMRNELAHGVVSERLSMENPQKRTGQYIVSGSNGDKPLTKEVLKESIELSQNLSGILRKELLRGTNLEEPMDTIE